MSEGVDYSFSQPSAAGLAAAGKRFAGRYVGPGSGKFLTPAERDDLFANGLDIFLLAEGAANGALGGYNLGVQHGEQARAHAEALAAPWNTAIYFAVDFDVTAAQWPIVAQYLHGAAFGVGAPQVGIYGGLRAMQWAARDGVADWFFQTYAWSGGQWYSGNHVEQYHNGVVVAGGEVDLCRSMVADFGQWQADGRNSDQAFPAFESRKANDMAFRLIDPEGGQFVVDTDTLSDTGWSYEPIVVGDQDRILVAGGMGTANGSANDPKRDPFANNAWRPGTFGPSKTEVRTKLIDDIAARVAAKVVASLPPGQAGGPTLAQITAAVRAELDKTTVPSVPGTLGH